MIYYSSLFLCKNLNQILLFAKIVLVCTSKYSMLTTALLRGLAHNIQCALNILLIVNGSSVFTYLE